MEARHFTAAILAGGKNTRMNAHHKAFLDVGGTPIIQRALAVLQKYFDEVLVIANDPERYRGLGVPVYPDVIPGRGPLSGIHAALTHAVHPYVFVTACDMPFVSGRLARRVTEQALGWDCAVPKAGKHPEPLFSAYGKHCLPVIAQCLEERRLKVMDLLAGLRVNYLKGDFVELDEPGDIFFNVNNPEDLNRARVLVQPDGNGGTPVRRDDLPPFFCVVGGSDSGKTYLVTRLVRELRARGLRVGTVKHCPHGADLDVPGKDSWEHARAGAEMAVVATPHRLALFRELPRELSPEELAAHFKDMDLVVVEGYKHLAHPKILVRSERNWPGNPAGLFALVGVGLPELELPIYDSEDVRGLADLVIERFGLGRG